MASGSDVGVMLGGALALVKAGRWGGKRFSRRVVGGSRGIRGKRGERTRRSRSRYVRGWTTTSSASKTDGEVRRTWGIRIKGGMSLR